MDIKIVKKPLPYQEPVIKEKPVKKSILRVILNILASSIVVLLVVTVTKTGY